MTDQRLNSATPVESNVVEFVDHLTQSVLLYRTAAAVTLNNRSVVNTEDKVMRSRHVLDQIVDELDPTAEPQFNPRKGFSLTAAAILDLFLSEMRHLLFRASEDVEAFICMKWAVMCCSAARAYRTRQI
ncbi:hypothetical protein [Roseivivax sediminis]|uniref:Uncharacterized protein n=1 Tax=Roseivivax sediminis TaxID=936889 RepID=A0A1I2CVK6_9RHOB|nr:hypothetical protein [Roseivivax sediminis]SFE72336.1 hypothetical protein SAMN04515678_114104 [Roseivivax sediminis]